ncbi:Protein phosphatase 2C 1 [Tulasnella sp. JGI-2019a]|nr:Protein phosphatase 2C 1 [Tulasnella sp. JGI-2019a]KAG9012806.1 Protein phosphatase 2C 1 [Tulasnella sp. JGI-2019a]
MSSSSTSDSTAVESSSQVSSVAPTLTSFDNSPNARSHAQTWVDGSQTNGTLNQRPSIPMAYSVGVAEDMGSRRTMEDAYSFMVDFAGLRGQGYFAIFDGHAGKHAAEWCGKHFHEHLIKQIAADPDNLIPETMAKTFLGVDKVLSQLTDSGATHSGCTAVTAFLRLEDADGKQSFAPNVSSIIESAAVAYFNPSSQNGSTRSGSNSPVRSSTPTSTTEKDKPSSKREKIKSLFGGGNSSSNPKPKLADSDSVEIKTKGLPAVAADGYVRRVLYTANVGDARAVLSRSGKAIRLTYDHKGSDKAEVKRITEAGGFVLNNRVNGVLAVTRSLGDTAMKEFVVGSPYTSEMELTPEDEWLIIACDGLWDVVEDQPAVELIKDCTDPQQASEVLLKHALDNFSHDNVTVLVVKLNLGNSPKEAIVKTKTESPDRS